MPTPCPPTLLALQDTLERHPDARQAILSAEIAHREREIISLRSQRDLLQFQIFDTIKSALGFGVFLFTTGWLLSQLVHFSKSLQRVEALNAGLGANVLTRGLQASITSILPASTTLQSIAVLPEWTTQQLFAGALSVVVFLLILGAIRGVQLWQMSRRLKEGIRVAEGEIGTLRGWGK